MRKIVLIPMVSMIAIMSSAASASTPAMVDPASIAGTWHARVLGGSESCDVEFRLSPISDEKDQGSGFNTARRMAADPACLTRIGFKLRWITRTGEASSARYDGPQNIDYWRAGSIEMKVGSYADRGVNILARRHPNLYVTGMPFDQDRKVYFARGGFEDDTAIQAMLDGDEKIVEEYASRKTHRQTLIWLGAFGILAVAGSAAWRKKSKQGKK